MSTTLATVARLYVYPVKSMAAVPVEEAHVGVNGLLGDRRYSFVRADQAGSSGFPWMTGRQAARMLLYQPSFEQPPAPGQSKPAVRVRAPGGAEHEVDSAALRQELTAAFEHEIFLLKDSTGIFDTQPLSIFNLATVRALEQESGSAIDPRQFRANIYIEGCAALQEEQWLDRVVRIGDEVLAAANARDTRCVMVNIDPDTAAQDERVLRAVAARHDGQAGLYANVVRGGVVRVGDKLSFA